MDSIFTKTTEVMERALTALKKDLNSISTGRASPNLLDTVRVESYGNFVPLQQVANISVPDSSSITIQPWEKSMLNAINKAVDAANLGFATKVDGIVVRVSVPRLTEDRRKELVKLAKKYGEDKKVSIRNDRRDALEDVKKNKDSYSEDSIKKFNDKIQSLTDDYTRKIEELVSEKEKDILKI